MSNLEDTRNEIDVIDKQLVLLFEKRMKLVKDVINYKIENNIEILDSNRENFILEKNRTLLADKEYSKYLDELFITIMKTSKDIQQNILESSKNDK